MPVEDAHERAALELIPDRDARQAGETEAFLRQADLRLQRARRGRDGKSDVEVDAVPHRWPALQPAGRAILVMQAGMAREVLWYFRRAVLGEVAERGDDGMLVARRVS